MNYELGVARECYATKEEEGEGQEREKQGFFPLKTERGPHGVPLWSLEVKKEKKRDRERNWDF